MHAASEPNTTRPPDTAQTTVLDKLLQRKLGAPVCTPLHGVAIGRVAAVGTEGPLVQLEILGDAPIPAQAACPLPPDCAGRSCAVLFVGGDPAHPLIMGLLLDQTETKPTAFETSPEVRVDGQRIVIEAEQELELRCGESVILLQRDGSIEIRGNYITSQATATQRIRGGSVHMN